MDTKQPLQQLELFSPDLLEFRNGEGLVLKPAQGTVLAGLLSWSAIQGEIVQPCVFTGYAGVGKTTIVRAFIEHMKRNAKLRIGIAAPTHKAVKVLKKNAYKGVWYRTLHSWLGLKEKKNFQTGEVTYEPEKQSRDKKPPAVSELQFLVIDETSMVGDDLCNYLWPWVKKGLRVIFVGDPAQVFPVKHKLCIPFRNKEKWNWQNWELTEIIRQKDGNPIIEFVTEIRNNQLQQSFTPETRILEDGSGMKVIPANAIKDEDELFEKFFNCPEFHADSDHMKVICWRNATVAKYNERIRKIVFQGVQNLQDIMPGEKLCMKGPFEIHDKLTIPNSEEIEVHDTNTDVRTFTYSDGWGNSESIDIKYYILDCSWTTDDDTMRERLPVVHEDSAADFKKLCDKLADYANKMEFSRRPMMWKQFYGVKEAFAEVEYNYAITTHRAQGSTYKQCLVLQWDIAANWDVEDRNHILYTACTRPSHTLYIQP